jgi:hypothetical protein
MQYLLGCVARTEAVLLLLAGPRCPPCCRQCSSARHTRMALLVCSCQLRPCLAPISTCKSFAARTCLSVRLLAQKGSHPPKSWRGRVKPLLSL